MSIDVKCPQCGSELEAPESSAGKSVKCPDCDTVTAVPPLPPDNLPTDDPGRAIAAAPGATAISHKPSPEGRAEAPSPPPRAAVTEATLLAPARNVPARLASSCALLSLAPGLALLFGPVAVLLGLVGLLAGLHQGAARAARNVSAALGIGLLTAAGNWGLLLYVASVLGVPQPVVQALPSWLAPRVRHDRIDDRPPFGFPLDHDERFPPDDGPFGDDDDGPPARPHR